MAYFTIKIITAFATLIIVTQGVRKGPRHNVTRPTVGTLPPIPPDPCKNQPLVDSVEQAASSQKIVCLKTKQKDLEKQLEKIGGYPRRYVAITEQDACNFTFPSSNELSALNIQQVSATTVPPEPQRDYSLAEDSSQSRSGQNSTVLECIGKADKNEETGFYHMCDMCWQTTTLEENKFPREISEIVCSGKKSRRGFLACLGEDNIGVCDQKVIKLQFLQWNGRDYEHAPESTPERIVLKKKWVQYTQQIRSCCDCEAHKSLADTFGN